MVSATEFRKACGIFPTGVTVVTRWHKEEKLGVTVSAFTSVSLDPPLVLVCVRMGSTFLEGITDGDPIFINILASHQSSASDRFSRLPPPQRFRVGDWEQLQLKEALAVMACRLHRSMPAGDHAVLLLSVDATRVSMQDPLVWWGAQYWSLDRHGVASGASTPPIAAAGQE